MRFNDPLGCICHTVTVLLDLDQAGLMLCSVGGAGSDGDAGQSTRSAGRAAPARAAGPGWMDPQSACAGIVCAHFPEGTRYAGGGKGLFCICAKAFTAIKMS